MSGSKIPLPPVEGAQSVARSGEIRVGMRAAAEKLLADLDAGFAETDTVGAPEAPSVLRSMADLRDALKHEAELAEAVAVAGPGDVVFASASPNWSPEQCQQAHEWIAALVPKGVSVILLPRDFMIEVMKPPLVVSGSWDAEDQERWEATLRGANPMRIVQASDLTTWTPPVQGESDGRTLADCRAKFEPNRPFAGYPKIYDSLRTVLLRPDVQEAIAKGLCAHNGGDWMNATEAGRNAFREDATKLLESALEKHLSQPNEPMPLSRQELGDFVSRRTGRTTSLLAATPDGATFIVPHRILVDHCKSILRSYGRRTDAVRIITAEQANRDGIRGLDRPVHLDHDCEHRLTPETIERIRIINERAS